MIKKDMALIERRKQTGVTAVNEPILSWITVIRSLPCDIQPDRASVVMQEAGQTVMQGKTLFCSPVDIQEKDRITDLRTGIKYFADQVLKFHLIDHLEVKLGSGEL